MSITDTWAYRSAEWAYENANPYDDDCTCADVDLYMCDDCGHISPTPGPGECDEPACTLREATTDEKAENMPNQTCPAHGYCRGCNHRNCGDCQ